MTQHLPAAPRTTNSHPPNIAEPANDPIRAATSPAEIHAALTALHACENDLVSRLNALLVPWPDVNQDLSRLDNLRAGLDAQVITTYGISNATLAEAADTAGMLSGRICKLDLEKSRVEDTLQVVDQVAELKACLAGVVGSMGAPEDWETAASYISRASKIPEEIIYGEFAAAVVPTVEMPEPPWMTLENARESLCELFLRQFEEAAKAGDKVKVTRFFKLFPLIDRGSVGVDAYGRYVCQGVAGTVRATLKEGMGGSNQRGGFFYANALTKLFEHIAEIIENHSGLVARHYGRGNMIKVIEKLQVEVDVQGGIIVDSWSNQRELERKLTDIKSYPFSFLVHSALSQQKGITGTSRPVLGGDRDGQHNDEYEGIDVRETDGLLSEIAMMLERWSLYTRFLEGKCEGPEIRRILMESNLNQTVSEKLIAPYNMITTFFFRRSVEKAYQLDIAPSGLSLSRPITCDPPFILQAVDDTMYIVNVVIQKAISTSQREVISSVVPAMGRILESDFIGIIHRKMWNEPYSKPMIQKDLPPEDRIIIFIVLMNSLDVSNEYLTRIVNTQLGVSKDQTKGIEYHPSLKDAFPFDHDAAFVTNALNTLKNMFSSKTTELLNAGLQNFFKQIIKPRLQSVLTASFRGVDYTLSEDELAELAEQNAEDDMLEQVTKRFEHGWDALMRPISRIMTPKTLTMLVDFTARHLAMVLERRLWSYSSRTNAFGAIRMERDFSGIVSTVSKGNYGIRELFAKVMQILMVTNMDKEEWEGVTAETSVDGIQWVLSGDERKKARNLVGT